MEEQDLISVIIPVYNVELYLDKCLTSVMAQSYRNLQIILVDDGSTDRSGQICDKYEGIDSRIIVIHQENRGVSSARNVALELAAGTYIVFVDSDDFLPEHSIEMRIKNIGFADMLVGNICNISVGGHLQKKEMLLDDRNISSNELLWYLFNENICGYQGFLFDKLFRLSIINKNQIRFDEHIKMNEDRIFIMKYLLCSGKVQFVSDNLYYYRQREDSVLGQAKDTLTASELTVLDSFEYMKNLVQDRNNRLYAILCRRMFECTLHLMRKTTKKDYSIRRKLKKDMYKNAFLYVSSGKPGVIESAKICVHCLIKR